MLPSTMQDFPLTVGTAVPARPGGVRRQRGRDVRGRHDERASFAEVADRAERLAAGAAPPRASATATASARSVERPGAPRGVPRDPVHGRGAAHAEHPAVPGAAHLRRRTTARTSVVIVDDSLVPLLAKVAADLKTVEHYLVVGDGDAGPLEAAAAGADVLRYEDVARRRVARLRLARRRRTRRRRRCATRAARPATRRASCTRTARRVLHSMAVNAANALGLTERDTVLPIVPMFHANAWGLPYAAWFAGADVRDARAASCRPSRWRRMIDDGAADGRRARCRRSGPTCCATPTSTASTCRRSAWSCAAAPPCRAR